MSKTNPFIGSLYIFLTSLALGLSCYSQAQSKNQDDFQFLNLAAASKSNDAALAFKIGSTLGSYPLKDYVDYYQIKPLLFDTSNRPNPMTRADSKVMQFLSQYSGTSLAEKLKGDWLLVLGARKDWDGFDKLYPSLMRKTDVSIQCLFLQSQTSKGPMSADDLASLRGILSDQKGYTLPCQDLVLTLAQRHEIGESEIRMISRSALIYGMTTFAKKLFPQDPLEETIVLAKREPIQAHERFIFESRSQTKEDQSVGWGVIAYYLAKTGDERAFQDYSVQLTLGSSLSLPAPAQEWRVRAGIRAKDWYFVKASIESMSSDVIKKDESWRYWYAVAIKELSGREAAKKWFLSVAGSDSFYGILAKEELGLKVDFSDHTTSAASPTWNGQIGLAKALKLYEIGLREDGHREWSWSIRDLSDGDLISVARYAKDLGLYDRMIATVDKVREPRLLSLKYPVVYTQEVGKPTPLLYAVMRQESRFFKDAASTSGAVGLMQVMPSTSQHVALKMKLMDYHPGDLAGPRTNLQIGSLYLGMLSSDLGGSPVLVASAYNAGPAKTKQWVKTFRTPVDGAVFIENIPYPETRNYVKQVLINLYFYEFVFSHREPSFKRLIGLVSPQK